MLKNKKSKLSSLAFVSTFVLPFTNVYADKNTSEAADFSEIENKLYQELKGKEYEPTEYKKYLHEDSLLFDFMEGKHKNLYNIDVTGLIGRTLGTASTAQNLEPEDIFADSPFAISIDGYSIADGSLINKSRKADLEMHLAEISIRHNSSMMQRRLNILPIGSSEEGFVVKKYSNYPVFVKEYELRIFDKDNMFAKPIKTIISEQYSDKDSFIIDEDIFNKNKGKKLFASLRAYDNEGNFDETILAELNPNKKYNIKKSNAGYGTSRLARTDIDIAGGTVIIEGSKVKEGTPVKIMGQEIASDNNGNFVAELIVPNGFSEVTIDYVNIDNKNLSFERSVEIKENDLFLFALGDLTLGRNNFSGPLDVEKTNPEEFEEEYIAGRAAFYANGKVLGEYNITAAADTGEGEIEELVRSLDDKNPRSILRRLDADRYYPVYGDGSTIEETAPTQGKAYLKIERDKSYLMWGSYESDIRHTDFAHLNRTLYGAKLKQVSKSSTKYGEDERELVAFFADPSTFPVRDEFRGTGGSVYFMEYQDITIGSEKIRVEVRDRFSGIVNYTKDLVYGVDYDVDYIKGRVLLTEPLSATSSDGDVISTSGAEFGDPVFLIADYETTPTQTTIKDNHIFGGTIQHWLNDYVKLGFTGSKENTKNGEDKQIYGGNATLRLSPESYVKASVTTSQGDSRATNFSENGGYSSATSSVSNQGKATAYDVELGFNLKEFYKEQDLGLAAYYRNREAGFAGQGYSTSFDVEQFGGSMRYNFFKDEDKEAFFKTEVDFTDSNNILLERYMAELGFDNKKLFVTAGAEYQKQSGGTDILTAGGKVGAYIFDNSKVYAFGQHSLQKSGNVANNDRYGLGADIQVLGNLSLGGEIALNKEKDISGKASATYQYDDATSVYLNYGISADNNGAPADLVASPTLVDNGVLTFGGRTRYGSDISIYAEENFYHGKANEGLTQAYGVDFTPGNNWSLGFNIETGEVNNFKRDAYAANIGYNSDDGHINLAGEYRKEEPTNSSSSIQESETYVARLNSSLGLGNDFTLLARGNASFSEGNQTNVDNGEFAEGSLGFAYRPTDNDSLNILARYQYYYDLATSQQINNGTADNYRQKSHIASLDFLYDVNSYFTLGAKYGIKIGEVDLPQLGWTETTTHLGVVRLDYHVLKSWDAMLEGRMLYQEETETTDEGALAGLYYHVNDNIKAGAGYSWSEFSDDLTSTNNYDNSGYYLNLISKF